MKYDICDKRIKELLVMLVVSALVVTGCAANFTYAPEENKTAIPSLGLEQARAEVKQALAGKFFISDSGSVFDGSGDGGDNQITDVKFIGNAIVFIGTKKPASVLVSSLAPRMRLNTNAPWCELFFKNQDGNFPYLSSPISNTASYSFGINVSVSNECDVRLVDALVALKQATEQADKQQSAEFEAVAANYRAASPKPGPTEAIHRFEVQGNGAIQDKDFYGAADIYAHGIAAAPWWPPFHYNLALILGELEDYQGAITEMQRYLALVPNAGDARAAQDKIYEWQAKDNNTGK